MSEKDLIDISKRPNFKELTAKGGRAVTQKKIDANLRSKQRFKKCKNCKFECEFREYALESDPESRCLVPTLRYEAVKYKTAVRGFDEAKIGMWLSDVITLFVDLYQKTDDDKKREKYAHILYQKLLPLKEKYFPATQRQLQMGAQLIKVELVGDKEKKEKEEKEKVITLTAEGEVKDTDDKTKSDDTNSNNT